MINQLVHSSAHLTNSARTGQTAVVLSHYRYQHYSQHYQQVTHASLTGEVMKLQFLYL